MPWNVTSADRSASRSAPGGLGHEIQALFKMAPGLVAIPPGDTGHRHSRGDDHIRQFGEQVITGPADPCARVYLLTELRGSLRARGFRLPAAFVTLPGAGR